MSLNEGKRTVETADMLPEGSDGKEFGPKETQIMNTPKRVSGGHTTVLNPEGRSRNSAILDVGPGQVHQDRT